METSQVCHEAIPIEHVLQVLERLRRPGPRDGFCVGASTLPSSFPLQNHGEDERRAGEFSKIDEDLKWNSSMNDDNKSMSTITLVSFDKSAYGKRW